MPACHLIELQDTFIYDQLILEERLLRIDERNFCLINYGSPPAIVMGISGQPEQLVHLEKAQANNVPLIKRFSGGGTVVVNEETLFVTFIFNKRDLEYSDPKAIMKWSESLYKPLFPGFHLEENDYVFGQRKFAGNAQYIRKERWLHHTSFLWDFKNEHMELLKLPEKAPVYRQGRAHSNFLCTLKEHFSSKKAFKEALKESLKESFELIRVENWEDDRPFRQSTMRIELALAGEAL